MQALTYALICKKLSIVPGRNSSESLDKIKLLLEVNPSLMAKINDAIDYASKEVMVLQSSLEGGNHSFSCTYESSSDSLESSKYSSQ